MFIPLLLAQLCFASPKLPADTTGPSGMMVTTVVKQPSFPGGTVALNQFLATHVSYPRKAIKKNITGTVRVGFVVEPDGRLTNLRIVSQPLPYLDEEALRIIKAMPNWIPAELEDGQKAATLHIQPVTFKLE